MTIRKGARVLPIEGEVNVILTRTGARQQPQAVGLYPGQLLMLKAGQISDFSLNSAKRLEQQWVSGVKSYDYVPIRDVIAEPTAIARPRSSWPRHRWNPRNIRGHRNPRYRARRTGAERLPQSHDRPFTEEQIADHR